MNWDGTGQHHHQYSPRARVRGLEDDPFVVELGAEGVVLMGEFDPNLQKLEVELEINGVPRTCTGQVSWKNPIGHSGRFLVGVTFENGGPVVSGEKPPDETRGSLRSLSDDEIRHLESLASISDSLNRTNDPETLLNTMLECLLHHLNAERALMLTPGGSDFEVSMIVGGDDVSFSKSAVYQVFETGKPLVSLDAIGDTRFEQSQSIQMLGTRSILCAPLLLKEKCLGVIYLDNSITIGAFSDAELHLAKIVADMAAAMLEKADFLKFLKDSQRDLAVAHQELHSLVELNSDGILVVDEDMNLLYKNPAAQNFLGDDFAQLSRFKGVELSELTVTLSDGSQGIAELSSAPTNWKGQKAHLLTLRDVTRLREQEAELRQAQKMQAVARLTGGIAHDFNNILATIMGSAELLNEPGGENPDELQDIIDASKRAARLTQKLLTFSKSNVRKPENIFLEEVVESQRDFLQTLFNSDFFSMDWTDDLKLPIYADKGEIGQVILNLVSNARDATSNQEKVRLTLRQGLVADVPHAIMEVQDNGEGMTSEVQEKMFEPFFSTRANSTGLGLATVYGIVESGGGQISVTSKVGDGSSFIVSWPLLSSPSAPTTAEVESTRVRSEQARLVLVEDEPILRQLVVKVLKKAGHSVSAFECAEDALDLNLEDYDLLLSDVSLPGLNGLELAKKLQQQQPNLKVILMSGYTEAALHDLSSEEQDFAFLQKPFVIGDLKAKVRELLQEG